MKRKIEDFLRELQPEHASEAIKEYNNYRMTNRWALSDNESIDHSDALAGAFDWTKSEKGYVYWGNIFGELLKGSYIFPTKEESQDEKENIIYNFEKMIYLSERLLDFEMGDGDDNYKKMINEAKESVEELKSKYKISRL